MTQYLQKERAEAIRLEDEDFKQCLLERFAQEDRVEQINLQKRRLKIEEHKREAARLVAEKRAVTLAEEVGGGPSLLFSIHPSSCMCSVHSGTGTSGREQSAFRFN